MRDRSRRALVGGLLAAFCLGLASVQVAARTPSLHAGLAFAAAAASGEEGKNEGRELIYKIINLTILVGALAYLLRKPAADFFAQRSRSIRTGLEEGRKALEASQAQLKTVEEKLKHLEEEIGEFKTAAIREMEAERQRLKLAGAEAAEKIIQSARAQTEAATRAAKVELKMYAADQAVKLAEEIIRRRLDDAGRKKLVADFVAGVKPDTHRN